MAITTTTTIEGSKTGGNVSHTLGPLTLTNSDGPQANTVQAFAASTFEAVSVPELQGSGAITGVIIMPPSGNTGTITLKGVTGDTGIDLHKTKPTALSLNSTTNLGLLCSANTTIEFWWY